MSFLHAWQIVAAKINLIIPEMDIKKFGVNRSIHHRDPKDKRDGWLHTVFTISMPLLPEMVRIA